MAAKKILYVINHADWFWSHRLPLALGAQKDGWQVHVAVPGGADDPRFAKYGFAAHNFEGRAFHAIGSIRTLARDLWPDLVHAVTLKTAFLTGLALGSDFKQVFTIAGLGFLFSDEGLKPKLLRLVTGPFLKRALRHAALVVQNPDDRKTLENHGFSRPGQCALIRGSGVDLAVFTPQPGLESDPPVVLMPTRLIREKGVSVFADAARILKHRGVQVRCVVAGGLDDDNPHALTASEMKKYCADGALEWPGKISDIPRALAECALVAYPSWYGEGIPKVLLEAAACGKAIITTDHPGCREAVRHGENGLLVPVKDAQALAGAIEELLNNPARRQMMGEQGRKRAEKEFDVNLIVEQTLKVYKKI